MFNLEIAMAIRRRMLGLDLPSAYLTILKNDGNILVHNIHT